MSGILKTTVIALLVGSVPVAASDTSKISFKPLHAISMHLGSKHAVGYFQTENGVCRLTLVVGEELKGDELLAMTPARFSTSVVAGQNVRFDAGQGRAVEFHCAAGALTMSIQSLSQTAYAPPRSLTVR